MPDSTDFAPIYDFSLIEKAVQRFFVELDDTGGIYEAPLDDDDPARGEWKPTQGCIAFYTAFQALTFQKCRPRVWCSLNNIVPFNNDARRVDGAGASRVTGYRASMRFGVITAPKYPLHVALRGSVASLIPLLGPTITADGSQIATGGINAFLEYHEIATFELAPLTTAIAPEEGVYRSDFDCNLTFGIRPDKWPI
jgi:hypothetical protein